MQAISTATCPRPHPSWRGLLDHVGSDARADLPPVTQLFIYSKQTCTQNLFILGEQSKHILQAEHPPPANLPPLNVFSLI